MTRFFSACVVAAEGAGAAAAVATGSGAGAGAAAGAGAGAGAAAAAGAGLLAGSSITLMMFSDTPASFSFTRSAGVRSSGLLSLFRVLTIRLSDNPALTDSMTDSTGDGAAFAGAAFAAALALGAALGAGACPRLMLTAKPARSARPNVNDLSVMLIPPCSTNGNGTAQSPLPGGSLILRTLKDTLPEYVDPGRSVSRPSSIELQGIDRQGVRGPLMVLKSRRRHRDPAPEHLVIVGGFPDGRGTRLGTT